MSKKVNRQKYLSVHAYLRDDGLIEIRPFMNFVVYKDYKEKSNLYLANAVRILENAANDIKQSLGKKYIGEPSIQENEEKESI